MKFTYAVIPDTHTARGDRGLREIVQWVEDGPADAAIHLGDVAHGPEDGLRYASACLNRLIETPIAVCPGNHDAPRPDPRSLDMFSEHIDDPNTGLVIEAGFRRILLLSVEFGPRNRIMDWAERQIAEHDPDMTVLATHSFLGPNGELVEPGDLHSPSQYNLGESNTGSGMWSGWMTDWDSLVAVHSGHHITGGETAHARLGGAVAQFSNYQDSPDLSPVRLVTLRKDRGKAVDIDVPTGEVLHRLSFPL